MREFALRPMGDFLLVLDHMALRVIVYAPARRLL